MLHCRRFQCNVCDTVNEVPPEYAYPLMEGTNIRQDADVRPELSQVRLGFATQCAAIQLSLWFLRLQVSIPLPLEQLICHHLHKLSNGSSI